MARRSVLAAFARMLVVSLAGLAGCDLGRDDVAAPLPVEETLPALELTDTTPDLLLTWIDDRGGTHTGVAVGDVPEPSRAAVRVVAREAGHGQLFYVADLTAKRADGTYAVRHMPRAEWEQRIEERRRAWRAKHDPPPAPPAVAPTATAETGARQAEAGVTAIIYGAAWCGPCHQAAAYLKRRGAHVVEHDIEREPRYRAEMARKLRAAGLSGSSSIPVLDVGGTMLQGFHPPAIDRALGKARSRSTPI
jgi:glutaredoxin